MKTLHTARLRLEPLGADHAEAMFAVLSDPAIYDYENQPPASVDALRARYRRLEARRSPDGGQQWLNWVLRATAELLGCYAVRRLTAVLKQRNTRSLRLLERLGFEPADAALAARHEIEPDERLMIRLTDTATP